MRCRKTRSHRARGDASTSARTSRSCSASLTFTCTSSPALSSSTMRSQRPGTGPYASGKLMPARRGHESHVASCGSHSAGMRYPSARGVRGAAEVTVSVEEALGDVAVCVDAAIAQERPVGARLVDEREVAVDDEELLAIGAGARD